MTELRAKFMGLGLNTWKDTNMTMVVTSEEEVKREHSFLFLVQSQILLRKSGMSDLGCVCVCVCVCVCFNFYLSV